MHARHHQMPGLMVLSMTLFLFEELVVILAIEAAMSRQQNVIHHTGIYIDVSWIMHNNADMTKADSAHRS